MRKRILLIILLQWIISFSLNAETHFLNSLSYYSTLLKDIGNAKQSITVIMYLIALPSNPPNNHKIKNLLDELVLAHKKGISIKIILDHSSDDDKLNPGFKNRNAIQYLRKNGIIVLEDTVSVLLHSKAVFIDSRIAYIGSCNWSKQAFEKNVEHIVRVENPDIIKQQEQLVEQIKLSPVSEEKLASIPAEWLKKNGFLLKLFKNRSERAFDLLLLLQCEKNPDYETIAAALGLNLKEPVSYRRAINRELKKLANYNILQYQTGYNQPFAFQINSPKIKKIIHIPLTYCDNKWNQTLTLQSKIALFLLWKELKEKTEKEIWLNSWQKKYGISTEYSRGLQELRQLGIITIEYAPFEKGKHKAPSKVQYLGLYNPKERARQFEHLISVYGDAMVEKARKYAETVFLKHNPQRTEEIIKLMEHDPKLVKKAFKYVSRMASDNPKRNIRYVYGIIQNERTSSNSKTD